MSEEYVGIQKLLFLVIYGLSPLIFLQIKQLISLVVFILQNQRGGNCNCLLLPVTGYAHDCYE